MLKIFSKKEKKIKNKIIVCIGGGTGLYSVLSGLKNEVQNENTLKAIVTMFDNGGSSGKLITQFGILPPGDIRNCMVALSDETQLLAKLFQFRFDKNLEDHNFGNLLITALTKITGDFGIAVKEASNILKIKGEVIPVSFEENDLVAEFTDKTKITGESQISKANKIIKELYFKKKTNPNKRAIEMISKADLIIFGPGSLYTSIIPNLLFPEINKAIKENKKSKKILITSVMSQPGETDNFTISKFKDEIEKYLKTEITHILVNNHIPPTIALEKYRLEGKHPIPIDSENIKNCIIIKENLIDENKVIRHDPNKLAKIIKEMI